MHHKPFYFLWSVIKPYKYQYLIMMLAPFGSALYPIIYNYAVKLLIDLFTQSQHITIEKSYKPIAWFIGAQVMVYGGWRAHNFAQLKCMPILAFKHVRKEEALENASKSALAQIQVQAYHTEILQYPHVQEVVAVGIAFSGKSVIAALMPRMI